MLVIIVLCILLIVSMSTDPNCWLVFNDPSTHNFEISLDPGKLFTGIVTIEGKLHPDNAPDRGTVSDILQFIMDDDPNGDEPIMQIKTQVGRSDHAVDIRGALKGDKTYATFYPTSDSAKIEYMKHPDADNDGKFWVYRDNDVILQISDIGLESHGNYSVFAGEPGDPKGLFTFNYGSAENWEKFKDRRLISTKRVRNKDENGVMSYFIISVCADPQPLLRDVTNYEIIKADLGRTYTLFCSASGAPYLASLWRDEKGMIIDGYEEVVIVEGSDYYIESKLVIADFNDKDAGNYTCNIFNKNFRNSVEKRVRLCLDCETETTTVSTQTAIEGFSTCPRCSCLWYNLLCSVIGVIVGTIVTVSILKYQKILGCFQNILGCFQKKTPKAK